MSTTGNSERHFGPCVQVGVVVRDLDRTIQRLTEIFGIGPFRTVVYPPPGRADIETTYHGEPGQFKYRQAFASLGSVELEIIQPLEGPSIWSDFVAAHGEGIHHIRFNVAEWDDTLAYLKGKDIQVLQSGTGLRPGTVWANLSTEEILGFTIELMKPVPGTDGKTPEVLEVAAQGK